MSQQLTTGVAVVGVDIGKNSFHIVGLDKRGAIVLRQKWSRGQVEARLANLPSCNCPPRWNGAPNQGLPVGFHELLEDSHKLLAYLTAITIVIYIAGAASTPVHQAK